MSINPAEASRRMVGAIAYVDMGLNRQLPGDTEEDMERFFADLPMVLGSDDLERGEAVASLIVMLRTLWMQLGQDPSAMTRSLVKTLNDPDSPYNKFLREMGEED